MMTLTPGPEVDALFPLVGLIAAIAFTHILRGRRSPQLAAIEITERCSFFSVRLRLDAAVLPF